MNIFRVRRELSPCFDFAAAAYLAQQPRPVGGAPGHNVVVVICFGKNSPTSLQWNLRLSRPATGHNRLRPAVLPLLRVDALSGLLLACLLLLVTATASTASEAPRCTPWTARLAALQGSADVRFPDSSTWRRIGVGQTLCLGDRVRVAANSRAVIELRDETILRLDQKTTLLLPDAARDDSFWVDLTEGALYLLSRIKRQLEIRTPFVNAGLEGTEFVVRVLQDRAVVSVLEGRVAVSNPSGRLSLLPGQTAAATADSAPVLRLDIRPDDAVRWALFYPLVLDRRQAAPGDSLAAAQQALATGRIDDAERLLQEVRASDPANPVALALSAMIELVRNDTGQALQLARQAVAGDPTGSSALLASSYASQAAFDIAGATSAIETSLQHHPQDALSWSRLAELRASLGDSRAAYAAAEHAVDLAPELSRTQTVLGFMALSALDLETASVAFETASALDGADPLPRLGLGLVLMRRGDVDDSVRAFEVATSLDPSSAMLRSYLGKAYVEQGRDRAAGIEFDRAKALDPLDPTPWLYDSLRKLGNNEAVAALEDIQQSLRLNDNRAVTRSRLLLDADRATRSADQGQVYRELGFERLLPGSTARSLMRDPGSAAIHRLQSTATAPRQQAARVSELLQWQLNSPLTPNLLQLQQTEADLVVTSAADLVASSAADWSQLFVSDGASLRLNAVGGGNDLFSNDLAFSYQAGPVVFGLAQYHYEFDGYAGNNDQERDIYGALVQWQVAPGTTLFTEYRDDQRSFGDLSLGFDNSDIAPDLRTDSDSSRWRVGGRHAFTPTTAVVATVAGFDSEQRQRDKVTLSTAPLIETELDTTSDDDGWLGELQLIHRTADSALIAGIGYFEADSRVDNSTASTLILPGLPPIPLGGSMTTDSSDTRQTNAYAYWSRAAHAQLDLTLALAYDSYDGLTLDQDQFSPKAGFVWQANDALRLRGVAARGMKRALVAEQTIEPTQVAGFTQMFDDPDGSDTRLYGLAADVILDRTLVVGAELRKRDLKVPFFNATTSMRDNTDWDETNGLVYALWTPTERLAIGTELSVEDLDFGETFPRPDQPWSTVSLDTVELPVTMVYAVPSGLTLRATARWIDQQARLIDTAAGAPFPVRTASDDFWTFDAVLEHRLPNRLGRVAVGVQNLFDEAFGYQEPDLNQPNLARERTVFVRVNLAL